MPGLRIRLFSSILQMFGSSSLVVTIDAASGDFTVNKTLPA
jgi:hypothetical protein